MKEFIEFLIKQCDEKSKLYLSYARENPSNEDAFEHHTIGVTIAEFKNMLVAFNEPKHGDFQGVGYSTTRYKPPVADYTGTFSTLVSEIGDFKKYNSDDFGKFFYDLFNSDAETRLKEFGRLELFLEQARQLINVERSECLQAAIDYIATFDSKS